MAEFTLTRGLQNIYVAAITEDSATAFTTETPYKLIPAGEMSISVDGDSTSYWFDNTVFATVGREGTSEITISGAGLRAAAIAVLNGKEVDATTGAVLDQGVYGQDNYFAFGAEKNNIDGTSEMFWFLKGTFSIPEENAKTIGEDTDATGTELTFTAIPTTHVFSANNKICKRVVMDTETTEVISTKNWFGQVVTPDNLSTIVQAKS